MPTMSPSSVPEDEPLLRLERYLAEDTIRIEQGREKLIDIGDALMTLRARMHNINLGEDPGVQVLTQEMAAPMIDRIAGSVDRTDNVILDLAVGAGREEVNGRHERSRAVEGQQQRVSDLVGTEFIVLGDEAVITLSVWGDPTSPYTVIRNPGLVACFGAWFDLTWSLSPEIEVPEGSSDDALIRMLALGAKDEMIARTLHVGLRTVRRRVAALMDQYGVGTRFQLGAALERDGRLESTP